MWPGADNEEKHLQKWNLQDVNAEEERKEEFKNPLEGSGVIEQNTEAKRRERWRIGRLCKESPRKMGWALLLRASLVSPPWSILGGTYARGGTEKREKNSYSPIDQGPPVADPNR